MPPIQPTIGEKAPSPARPRASWVVAWLLLTLAIALWKRDILFSLPYWDSAMGLYYEADFLARSDFDYQRLFFEEPRFLRGGPAVYLTSILPTFVAALMKVIRDPPWVHFAYRLFTMACASAVLLAVFAWVRPRSGNLGAVLVALALATTPPFSVQIELLGMEFPLIVMSLVVAGLACRERYVPAAVCALAAFFIKANGMLIAMALLTYVGVTMLLLAPLRGRQWRDTQWIALAAAAVAVAIERSTTWWLQSLPNYEEITGFFSANRGLDVLARSALWCPDVAFLFAFAFLVSVIYLGARAPRWSLSGWLRGWQTVAIDDSILLFAWILVGGILVSHAVTYVIPRYFVFPLVFVFLGLGRMLFAWQAVRPWACALLCVLSAVNLWNQDGRLYPPIPVDRSSDLRTGAILERSREYLADHRDNVEAVRAICNTADRGPIVAPNPFVHFLSIPSLGYVQAPLSGFAVNEVVNEHFRPVEELRSQRPNNIILFDIHNRFTDNASCEAPRFVPERDVALFRADSGGSMAVFVASGKDHNESSNRREAMLRLWPWLAAMDEARSLEKSGRLDQAAAILQSAIPRFPKDAEIRTSLGELYERAGRIQDAVAWYQSVPLSRKFRASAMDQLANLLRKAGKLSDADKARSEARLARWFFPEELPPAK